jgi:hypothetical protein
MEGKAPLGLSLEERALAAAAAALAAVFTP